MSKEVIVENGRVVPTRFPGPHNPYPKDYNPRVHGPYDPSRYYGKTPKTPLWDVKLGNLFYHVLEADLSRPNIANTITRFFARYHARHLRVRKRPLAPMLQLLSVGGLMAFVAQYGFQQDTHGGIKSERRFKYH